MKTQIDIKLHSFEQNVLLYPSYKKKLELQFTPIVHQINIDVFNFPSFTEIIPKGNSGLTKESIGFNILSQRLIVDTDPLNIIDIDSMTLSDLDIGQNKTIYNI